MTDQQDKHNGTPAHDKHARAGTDTPAPPADAVSTETSTSRQKSPLITAVEIENFKGIGAPVRIDLRPITLLFGNNSAGKSTLLHALCYAHEILNHRSADVHKTELGGDQIDLGGFPQFVHGHDPDRSIRLRFELNLENWSVPEPIQMMVRGKYFPYAGGSVFEAGEDVERFWENDPVNLTRVIRVGWIELIIAANSGNGPILKTYEVGINEAIVGRIEQIDKSSWGVLTFNWTHPLFAGLRESEYAIWPAITEKVTDAQGTKTDRWRLCTAIVRGGLHFPLPDWDVPLSVDNDHPIRSSEIDVADQKIDGGPGFDVLITHVLTGVGRTLRDELANIRYVGPIRELRPRTDPDQQENWSNGQAAWQRLKHYTPNVSSGGGDLLKDVNEWLSDKDRLNTNYKLCKKSIIDLPANEPSVELIREHNRAVATHGDQNGIFDPDRWAQKAAKNIAKEFGGKSDEIETYIRSDHTPSHVNEIYEKMIEVLRKMYQEYVELVAIIDKLEKGRPPSAVRNLVRAIAAAPERTELQLETAKTGLPVRTSDVGVGVSQILPVVVAALDPDRPGITAIEQPELHVHPRMQVELGDLFAQGVDQGGIFLIETHSEHLILRLLRRIEETHNGELPEGKPALKPDQVSVAYLEQIDGEVVVTPLRIGEEGEFIDRWPQGFFDERSDELF